jgi:hypothetical protein
MKRAFRLSGFVLVPLTVFLGTLGFRYAQDHGLPFSPALECPERIDLGPQERGEVAVGHFRVKNAGSRPLALEGFQTSCSCAGVEGKVDGRAVRLKALALAPGEDAELSVRVAVGAPVGQSQTVQVFFGTNDPARPLWQIVVLIPQVRGACCANPTAVIFGSLPSGTQARQVIGLYDNGVKGGVLRGVRATHPERFSARLLPLEEQEKQGAVGPAGSLIGRVEVTAHTDAPGPLEGEVLLAFEGTKARADPIPVTGEVIGLARCWPRNLTLPRRHGAGPRYEAEAFLESRDEKPIQVTVVSVPRGLSADMTMAGGSPERWVLHVKGQPNLPGKTPGRAERSICLHVVCDGQERELEVPVLLTEDRS